MKFSSLSLEYMVAIGGIKSNQLLLHRKIGVLEKILHCENKLTVCSRINVCTRIYILLTGLVVNMVRYCTSVQKYFPEPKVRENTAHECNVSPY